jgi:hypothetical protein
MNDSRTGEPVEPSGQLYMVQVGRTYLAFDPVKTAGEFTLIVVLDEQFHVLT